MRKLLIPVLLPFLFSACVSTQDHYQTLVSNYKRDKGSICEDWSLIHYAAAYGSADQVKAALETGGEIDGKDCKGNTPLIIAVLNNNYESFEALIESGADLTVKNDIEGDVVQYLGYFDNQNMEKAVGLLGDRDEFVHYRSSHGMNLAHFASYGLNRPMMEILSGSKIDLKQKEDLSTLTPIDMTLLTTYNYSDVIRFSEEDYKEEKDYFDYLISMGSGKPQQIPLNIAVFGNFLITMYATVDALFPFDIDLSYVNKSEYFTMGEVNQRPYAAMNKESLKQMFNNFSYDVEIDVYEQNIEEAINNCIESEHMYMMIANLGNHPYVNQHWVNINEVESEGSYKGYMEVRNPNRLFDQLYFRIEDISHLLTLKLTKK